MVLCLLAKSICQPKVKRAKVCVERLIHLKGDRQIVCVSRQVIFQSAIEKAVNTAEPLTSSLSMQYVIEPDAMPDRCNPSVVLNAAMYKRPGIISTAYTASTRLSKHAVENRQPSKAGLTPVLACKSWSAELPSYLTGLCKCCMAAATPSAGGQHPQFVVAARDCRVSYSAAACINSSRCQDLCAARPRLVARVSLDLLQTAPALV